MIGVGNREIFGAVLEIGVRRIEGQGTGVIQHGRDARCCEVLAQGVATFAINSFTRIVPFDGDYNFDGNLDGNDYPAWSNAFGQTSPDFSYADGNHDGVVDAADYVIWRSNTGLSGSGSGSPLVPEPSAIVLGVISLSIFVGYKRRRVLCR